MTTVAQHRAEMNALTITVAVETQLFRWAAEVDRLKGLNATLVEALEGLLDQLDGIGIPDWHSAESLCLKGARATLDTTKGEA